LATALAFGKRAALGRAETDASGLRMSEPGQRTLAPPAAHCPRGLPLSNSTQSASPAELLPGGVKDRDPTLEKGEPAVVV
jgi:hypothetical protein